MQMDDAAIAAKLAELDSRSKSNTKRLDRLEQVADNLNSMASSMSVMAEKMKSIGNTVDKLDGKVEALEAKPAKKYENLSEKVLWAIVAACITFILSHMGL